MASTGSSFAEEEWDRFFQHPALSFGNQAILEDLFQTISNSNRPVTLFLGAGVSLDAGLPSWNNLVANMASQIGDKRWIGPVNADASDPMRKAEYVIRMVKEDTSKSEGSIIRDALYPQGKEGTVSPGNLADAIGRLQSMICARSRVMTTNFDTLVDQSMSIYSAGNDVTNYSLGEWTSEDPQDLGDNSVLHLHGILEPNQNERGPVILTESSFLERGPDVRKRVEGALRDSCVIFIGVSLSDPNLIGPLWTLKNEGTKYEKPYVVLVASPLRGAETYDSRAYTYKRAKYLGTELNVGTVFLKSYAQIPQLVNDLALAASDPVKYMSNDASTSLRYGHRLTRTLDSCYTNVGCGVSEDIPTGKAAEQLSDRLHGALYGPGGIANDLQGLLNTVKNSNNLRLRKFVDEHRESLENERFGLFLWLRSRGDSAREAEYQIKLMGSSAYCHREPWSLDRVAPVEEFSRHAAAAATFTGLASWQNLSDSRSWQLWRGIVAVPFALTGQASPMVVGGTGRHLDVLSVGAITLNSTNQIVSAEHTSDGGHHAHGASSVLSAMQSKHQAELALKLAEIATDVCS